MAKRLRRVASMGMAEAGYRGWQESAKWIDRHRIDRDVVDPVAVLRREAPSIVGHAPSREAIDALFRQRFFAGVNSESMAALRRTCPDAGRHIQDEADALLTGRFDLLGYQGLTFGTPIDWQLDPVRSRRAPLVHWSQIDPLDADMVGDSKIAWELNRHQWVVRLAQASAITGDGRYATAAVNVIDQWINANPVGRGLNWASSLEVAFRLIAWTWVLALLRDTRAMSAAFTTRLFAFIHAHAAHIRKYLSYYFSPNTHLTGEALGLFYAGSMFPHFRDAADWRATGARILIEQSRIQISDDGVYFEQSTGYERYTCEFYLHFLLLAQRAGIAVPGDVSDRVMRMIEFLVSMRRPDGSMPLVGDADDGCLMPLVRREAGDFSGVFAVAAAWFRPNYAPAAYRTTPEVFWLLGPDGVRHNTDAAQASPVPPPSRLFARGGYAVMRSGWDHDAHHLIVDAGPLGCHVSGGHGHEDLLAIQCSVFGDRVLVDPGTYGYTAEPTWRNYFRSAAAHSTVTVDGMGQSEPAGPFGWRRRPRAVVREWITNAEFDLVDAEHNAYAHLAAPVIHRRRVVFVKPEFWVVIDDLTGTGAHTVELSFQFAPLPVELTSSGYCRVETERGSALWILPLATAPLVAAIRSGDTEPIRGWISARYGHKQPSPALVCSAATTLPLRAITVLYPTRDRSGRAPDVAPVREHGHLIGVRIGGAAVQLERDRVLVKRN